MFDCRIKENQFPEDGEVVLAKTVSIEGDILNMELLEYANIPGLVLSSELSKKRIRSIHQITKVGNSEVCQVLSVDRARGYIDLSLRSVGDKERKECLENASRNKIAYQIMLKTAKMAGMSVGELYEMVGYEKAREFGSLHSYFSKAKENPEIFNDSNEEIRKLGKLFSQVIDEQFKPSVFKVRADVDVTSAIGGIENIKHAFKMAKNIDNSLEIVIVRAPTYSITKIGNDKDECFDLIAKAIEIIKENIENVGGTFSIASAPKVYGEKNKHSLLDETTNAQQDDESDESSE